MQAEPNGRRAREQLALALAALGDEELFDGNAQEAQKLYDQYVRLYHDLSTSAELADLLDKRGLAHYRSGAAALSRGDRAASMRDFITSLQMREAFLRDYPKGPRVLSVQVALMLAQARCGQHEGAAQLADQLERLAGKRTNFLFQATCGYALCIAAVGQGKSPGALTEAERKLQARYKEKALAVFGKLMAAGYRDRRQLAVGPDLDPIRDEPGFQSALAKLK